MNPDERAEFREVLRDTAADLLAYFERRVSAREDAADLLGEKMLQAWRRVNACPQHDRVRQRMWLFTIAANVLRNHLRSGRRRTALADRLRDVLAQTPDPPDMAEANSVRDAVLRLGGAQRELVMLVHWDGFSITEAAKLIGMNPSTARGHYSAARAALQVALVEASCR